MGRDADEAFDFRCDDHRERGIGLGLPRLEKAVFAEECWARPVCF